MTYHNNFVHSFRHVFNARVPFQMKYAEDKGVGEHAEVLILCIGILSGVARIIIGKVADLKWINRMYLHQLGIFLLGVTTTCIPWATEFWHLVVITCVMGICDGCFVCLLGPIALDIVGPKSVSQAIGFLLGLLSIPMMTGPPIAGECTVQSSLGYLTE